MSKTYSNGEVSIVWKSDLCSHSANCVNGLPGVFDQKARPWINAEGAPTDAIVAQVSKCPSGALTTFMNADGAPEATPAPADVRIEVLKNGPLIVHSNVNVVNHDGVETRKEKRASFCRCGASANKPFCDGSHRKIGFEG